MSGILSRLYGSKKEYQRQMLRVEALPEDYRFMYDKIQKYMWSFAGGTGMDMLKTQYELIDLFETGAARKKHVLEITGKDVAAFCDGLMQDNVLWTERSRQRLNRKVNKRLYGRTGV